MYHSTIAVVNTTRIWVETDNYSTVVVRGAQLTRVNTARARRPGGVKLEPGALPKCRFSDCHLAEIAKSKEL